MADRRFDIGGGRPLLADFYRRAIRVRAKRAAWRVDPERRVHMGLAADQLEAELNRDALKEIRDGAPHSRVLAGMVLAAVDA